MSQNETAHRQLADTIIFRALELMQEQGVPFPTMMDRLLTSAAAHITRNMGEAEVVRALRAAADSIEAGSMAKMGQRGRSH